MALVVKNLPANAGSIPGLGKSPGEGNGSPLQCSCLENPMDREPGGLQPVGSQSRACLSELSVSMRSRAALSPSVHLLVDVKVSSLSWLL